VALADINGLPALVDGAARNEEEIAVGGGARSGVRLFPTVVVVEKFIDGKTWLAEGIGREMR
jgi:hypothetical protein